MGITYIAEMPGLMRDFGDGLPTGFIALNKAVLDCLFSEGLTNTGIGKERSIKPYWIAFSLKV